MCNFLVGAVVSSTLEYAEAVWLALGLEDHGWKRAEEGLGKERRTMMYGIGRRIGGGRKRLTRAFEARIGEKEDVKMRHRNGYYVWDYLKCGKGSGSKQGVSAWMHLRFPQ